jgi:transglutaminase-like putative cysteine protease
VAFRAEFPDEKIPPPGAMYWRGVVMSHGEGFEWRAPAAPAPIPRSAKPSLGGEAVRQWITIEAHNAHWIFALDWPAAPPPGTTLASGNYLWSDQLIRKPRRYEVRSFPDIREKKLQPGEREVLLEVPASISPAVRELVQSWTSANGEPRAVVSSALRFFRTQGFRYSLSPGEYKNNDLDEFLFRRRLGFCEHYAASFASLMRVAGIPARIVVGYLGGEYNEFGRFFVVRQADTHAWCEVWLPEGGWIRVDPTSVVAPERVALGLNSFLERRAASGQAEIRQNALVRNLARSQIVANIRLAWQTLSYAWDTRVLSFDAEAQESFLPTIGIADNDPWGLIVPIVMVAAGLLAIYSGWTMWRTHSRRDRVTTLYERFCGKAARLGACRHPCEGPSDFSRRAAQLLPRQSAHIQRISDAYIRLRYSSEPASTLLNAFAKEVKGFARTRRTRSVASD